MGRGGQGSVLERCLAQRKDVSLCLQSQKCKNFSLIFLQLHSTRTFQPRPPFSWGHMEFPGLGKVSRVEWLQELPAHRVCVMFQAGLPRHRHHLLKRFLAISPHQSLPSHLLLPTRDPPGPQTSSYRFKGPWKHP